MLRKNSVRPPSQLNVTGTVNGHGFVAVVVITAEHLTHTHK